MPYYMYVSLQDDDKILVFTMDAGTGKLTPKGEVPVAGGPSPLTMSPDRKGRYVLSSYYQGAHAAVHPVGNDGAVGGPPIEWLETAIGAHAIQTDPSNTFAFVPHIDNRGGPNAIFQFKFDSKTGHLTPNSPPRVGQPTGTGPRHFCFH